MTTLEIVLTELLAKLTAGLPDATAGRDLDKPTSFPAGGMISLRAGVLSEESEGLISSNLYCAVRIAELHLAGPEPTAPQTRQQSFAAWLAEVVAVVDADPTLNGTCAFVIAGGCTWDELSVEGAETRQTGILRVRLEYETTSEALA